MTMISEKVEVDLTLTKAYRIRRQMKGSDRMKSFILKLVDEALKAREQTQREARAEAKKAKP